MTAPGDADEDDPIRAEALRRLEQERLEAEHRAAEESDRAEREAAEIRDEARRRVAQQHIHERFGRTLATLHDPEMFNALMVQAKLHLTKQDLRTNPNGTTTAITTLTLPTLLGVGCNSDRMAMLFDGNMGHTLVTWSNASEILRSGLRGTSIEITEPRGGQFQVTIT